MTESAQQTMGCFTHKPSAPGPAPPSGTAGTYPLAADHRTMVSWSFSPTSSCSARTQEGRDHELHVLTPVLGKFFVSQIEGVTHEHHEGNHIKNLNSNYKEKTFPFLCF